MRFYSDIDWLNTVFPEGLENNESTLISGPGGSGKPLVALGIANAWLKAGGSLVNIPLQYPSMTMVKESMKSIYDTDLEDYKGRVSYVQFNPEIEGMHEMDDAVIEANLIKPEVWEKAIEKAKAMVEKSDLGVLVFASAINLLLFNKKYKNQVIETIRNALENGQETPMLLTVANNVFTDDINRLELAADNLMITNLDKDKRLSLKVNWMRSVHFKQGWHRVPVEPVKLDEIQEVAQASRKKNVKAIRNVE